MWAAAAFGAAIVAGGTGGYAYTAGSAVAGGGAAGQGSAAILPYAVSGVSFVLNTNDPSSVDGVAFTLTPGGTSDVRARVASAGGWYGCTNTAGSVTCATTAPQATATGVDTLTIVAVQ